MTILLDTTVLTYAAGDRSHRLYPPAAEIVRGIDQATIRATTTPEVLQEFMHVRSRRRTRENAQAWVERYAAMLSPLVVVGEHTILRAAQVFAERPSIGAFDAVLVAVLLEADDLELVTADRGLLQLDDVPVIDLASFG